MDEKYRLWWDIVRQIKSYVAQASYSQDAEYLERMAGELMELAAYGGVLATLAQGMREREAMVTNLRGQQEV